MQNQELPTLFSEQINKSELLNSTTQGTICSKGITISHKKNQLQGNSPEGSHKDIYNKLVIKASDDEQGFCCTKYSYFDRFVAQIVEKWWREESEALRCKEISMTLFLSRDINRPRNSVISLTNPNKTKQKTQQQCPRNSHSGSSAN